MSIRDYVSSVQPPPIPTLVFWAKVLARVYLLLSSSLSLNPWRRFSLHFLLSSLCFRRALLTYRFPRQPFKWLFGLFLLLGPFPLFRLLSFPLSSPAHFHSNVQKPDLPHQYHSQTYPNYALYRHSPTPDDFE
jgi:hypothetical protein